MLLVLRTHFRAFISPYTISYLVSTFRFHVGV
nr:MAG TPA: hypothetical protein [Caudoviricetes sp.]